MGEISEKNFEKNQESLEIQTAENLKLVSAELTLQEADDKVAALLEERRLVEDFEKNGDIDIGNFDMDKLNNLKKEADKADNERTKIYKELRDLKSKKSYEKDPRKAKELETAISKKQSEYDTANRKYKNKVEDYENYAKRLKYYR